MTTYLVCMLTALTVDTGGVGGSSPSPNSVLDVVYH